MSDLVPIVKPARFGPLDRLKQGILKRAILGNCNKVLQLFLSGHGRYLPGWFNLISLND